MIGHLVGRCLSGYIYWRCEPSSHRLDLDPMELQATVFSALDPLGETFRVLIRSSIQEYRVDSCLCSCSGSGCSPVVVLLKSTQLDQWNFAPHYMFPFHERVIEWIETGSATDCFQKLPLLVAADIIRFETFEMLGLSHTCCRGSQTYHDDFDSRALAPRFEISDIHEIREEEQDLLDDYERLVDDLIQAYEQHKESFSSFLTGFWRTKMVRWLTERRPTRQEDLVNMRRIGVVMDCRDEGGAADELINMEESDCVRDSTQCQTAEDKQTLAHSQYLERRISDEDWFTILRECYVR